MLEDTTPCPAEQASAAWDFLALFETVTGEVFADTPGIPVARRVAGLGRVMANITREVVFSPPLQQLNRRGTAFWTRQGRQSLDVQAWKAAALQREAFQEQPTRLRTQRAAVNAELAAWVKTHRYLTPVAVDIGESGMALLILWEVDHQQEFPRGGGDGASVVLAGFTRRLKQQVVQDPELSAWLECRAMQKPLSPGLPASHHARWSVRVRPPGPSEPQGWYVEFTRRWRLFLEDVAGAVPVAVSASSSSSSTMVSSEFNPGLARRRPTVRRPPAKRTPAVKRPAVPQSTVPPAGPAVMAPTAPVVSPSATPSSVLHSQLVDPPSAVGVEEPARKRQCRDLRQWLVNPSMVATSSPAPGAPPAGSGAGHGRAVQSSPV